jgi:hypothetical protein
MIIDAFSKLPDLMEVVGYGKVQKSRSDAAEVRIQVFLAHPDPFSGYTFARSAASTSCWVGCGHFSDVTIGSQWNQGHPTGSRSPDVTATERISFRGNVVLLDPASLQGSQYFPLDQQSNIPCYYLTLGDKAENRVALVPMMEFIRVIFGVSSGFFRPVLDGVRTSPLTRDRFLVDRKKSGRQEDGTVSLSCSRKPTRQEAIISALIATDDQVRRAHDSVFSELSANRSWQESGEAFAQMFYPFKKPVECSFEGRWISTRDHKGELKKRLLITRISWIDLPCEFNSIKATFLGGSHIENLPQAEGRLQKTHATVLRLQSNRAPTAGRMPLVVNTGGVSFETAHEIKITYDGQGSGARPEPAFRGDHQREEIDASTADRRSGGAADVAHVEIKRTQQTPERADVTSLEEYLGHFQPTYDAVVELAKQNKWKISRGLGRADKPDALVLVEWSRSAANLLLMVLETEYGSIVVADMGSAKGNARSLGLVAREKSGTMDQSAINQIVDFAKGTRGCWLGHEDKLDGFNIRAVCRRDKVWRDQSHYVGLVQRGINALFSRPSS